ncbi:MAG: dynamin family protein [Dehalococcoidales bacterium]|nr:dynamin family protein [Dehalococcoidales bacterium]
MLEPDREALLVRERHFLDELRVALAQVPASPDDTARLRQALVDLDSLFLLVVAGEFNSGKSAFINALVGLEVVPEGVTPTTTAINVLRYAAQPHENWLADGLLERGQPIEWLRHISVVDTPGANAVIRRHQEITERFVPRSDLVLFVTSVERPFSESERAFLEQIRRWGKKIIIVLNKIDLLQSERELSEVTSFVAEHSQSLLGSTPELFPVSSRVAKRAKVLPPGSDREVLWRDSRFEPLERFVQETLDDRERLRLKLLSPLGVAELLLIEYRNQVQTQLALLGEDVESARALERQIELYAEDVERDLRYRLSELELVLHKMGDRGERFFDETLRLGRAFDLFSAERVRGEFERKVIADTARETEDAVREISDWLVDREQRLWRDTADYLERRRLASPDRRTLGDMGRDFVDVRAEMMRNFSRMARQTMDGYDRESEAKQLAVSVRTAMAQTAVAEAGAVGLGAVVVALATTAAVDVTGILAASLVAGLGLFILPLKRRQAKDEFRRKVESLRDQLSRSVAEESQKALARTRERLREATDPYVRFVRSEHERKEAVDADLLRLREALATLRQEIG